MEQEKIMRLIKEGHQAYEKILGKELHYVYYNNKSKKYEELVIRPRKENFLHLCGIEYILGKEKVSGKRFYDLVKKSRIDTDKLRTKAYTGQKLKAIEQLNSLLSCESLRIIPEKTSFLNLQFEKGIRSRKMIFCLAFTQHDDGTWVPQSLLDLQSNPRKNSSLKSGYDLHCIYSVLDKSKEIEIYCKKKDFEIYESKQGYKYNP